MTDVSPQERLCVLVVVTARVEQGVALPPEVLAVRREPVSRTMTLSGLSEAGVGLLLRKYRSEPPSRAFTRDVFRITRGNALFVDSIARSVGIQSVSDVWQQHLLPDELDEAIATRLRALEGRAAETLAVAAVVGEPFDLPLMTKLQDAEPSYIDQVVSEATRAGLTVREGSKVRFAHPLFASAAADLLDPERRRAISTAAARLLADRWAAGEDAPVLRIAELVGHDEAAFTPEVRRSIATAAAHAALESYDWGEAGRWFESAARAERQMAKPSAVAEAELLRQAGAAYVNAGDVWSGVSLYERALPLLDEDRDRVPLVRLRCELLQALMVSLPPGSPIDTTQLERLAPTIESAAPRVSAIAYSNLVQAFWASGRNDDARAAARRGIELGTRFDEPQAVERSHQALAMAHWYRLELTEAASSLQAAIDVTGRVGDRRRQAASLVRLALSNAWLGATRDTAIEIDRARALFRTTNYSIEAPLLCVADAMLALARGEYLAVDDHVADGLAQVALSGYPWATTLLWANLARARLLSGRTEDLGLLNQQLAPPSRSPVTARGAHLIDVLAQTDLTRVTDIDLEVKPFAIDRSWLQLGGDTSLALLAEIAYFHERSDLAAAVLPHLDELWSRGQLFTSTMMMLLPRVVALAQWTLGEYGSAEAMLRRAAHAAEEAGAHSELALTEFALARCVARDESRRREAAHHAARARRLENLLGIDFLREGLDDLERRVGSTSKTATRPEDESLHVETVCIMFTDIASSTSLTEELGDWVFRSKARPLELESRAAIERHHGSVVDAITLGDGLLANFSSARDAIAAALACEEISFAHGLPLHIGLHAGDVLRERGNLFGGAVNLAARVCSLCEPGHVLVSQTFRDLARTSSDATFVEHGVFDLKGVHDPVRLFQVLGKHDAST
jgi:class 3 adenylate cyclase